MKLFDRERNSRHFLDKLRADLIRDPAAARASQEHARVVTVDACVRFHAL